MRRTAILVIAATNQPVYRHYLRSYWTEFIRHTTEAFPHLDVYLLVENGRVDATYRHVLDHVIEDPIADLDELLPPVHQTVNVPGILSKTIYALDVLGDRYDVFFRTNLSSMVMATAFDRFVQRHPEIGYSAAWGWPGALRSSIEAHGHVGPDRSIRDLADLAHLPGNTFMSGSGFFLSAAEAAHLVAHRAELTYGLPDDVAIGLMLPEYQMLPGFSELITADRPIAHMVERIEATTACHVRLQHLPLERAMALWRYVERSRPWR